MVVWWSGETYMALWVLAYELTREPGLMAAAFETAGTRFFFVTSPLDWNTATNGACSPVPNVFSTFWFVSYAEYPGIEKDSNQRSATREVANNPKRVSTPQIATTTPRRRWTRCASPASTSRGSTCRNGAVRWRLEVRLTAPTYAARRSCSGSSTARTTPRDRGGAKSAPSIAPR